MAYISAADPIARRIVLEGKWGDAKTAGLAPDIIDAANDVSVRQNLIMMMSKIAAHDHGIEPMHDHYDDFDDGDCPECHGEGFVSSCVSEYACIDPEGGCDLCTYPWPECARAR